MPTSASIGKSLKSIRASKGLTQEDFGVVSSRTYLSTLERDLKSPTIEKLDQIAAVLGVSPLTILIKAEMEMSGEQDIEIILNQVRDEMASL